MNKLLQSLLAVAVLVAGVSPLSVQGDCVSAPKDQNVESRCDSANVVGPCCACSGVCCRPEPERQPLSSTSGIDRIELQWGLRCRCAGGDSTRPDLVFGNLHNSDCCEAVRSTTLVDQQVRIQT